MSVPVISTPVGGMTDKTDPKWSASREKDVHLTKLLDSYQHYLNIYCVSIHKGLSTI